MPFEDKGAQLFVLMSDPMLAHTTHTHKHTTLLSAPFSSLPTNEKRANEGQLGDEKVAVVGRRDGGLEGRCR